MNRMRRAVHAFTLIEMLTVIAIIGILAGILIPAVQAARQRARIVNASSDISKLSQAVAAYSLDFGANPPDSTAFWTNPQGAQCDNPFPGAWNSQTPLCPNELLMWYLTTQFTAGSPATGYPIPWSVQPNGPAFDANGDWNGPPSNPSLATTVFSRVNAGPYFDIKAKQKTDVNKNGFYEFMDPWGRPYMYRAYPQSANVSAYSVNGNIVTLTLANPIPPSPIPTPNFITNQGLTNTTGTIQLAGFTNSNFNGTFTFQGGSPASSGTINVTFPTSPGSTSQVSSSPISFGQYTFPLHNKQTCDIYSLGPYGLTRAALMPQNSSFTSPGQEWKPTHGSSTDSSTDPTSLNAWVQVWGTPGDGNDINSNTGNVLINSIYQDNICNWN